MSKVPEYQLVLREGKPELKKRNDLLYSTEISKPELVADAVEKMFSASSLAEEYLWMLALNSKNKCIGVFEISHGTVDMSVCSPREILIRALLAGAKSIILVHNHPSGDFTPSDDDIAVCNRINQACKIIGVTLLDFEIVSNGKFLSFAEEKIVYER